LFIEGFGGKLFSLFCFSNKKVSIFAARFRETDFGFGILKGIKTTQEFFEILRNKEKA
jgi:hypothetical protein